MSSTETVSHDDLRVLICAPIGRDSLLTRELLSTAGVPSVVCPTLLEMSELLGEGAGAILLTEEALSDPHLDALVAALAAQPAWSDISVLLFAGSHRDEAALRTLRKLEILRNVTLLDRPVRRSAVISTVQAALRGRRRQYELRDVLMALHKARADAEEANRLKDEFLATVSHELRTPLNAIMGWVSLLRQARLEPERVATALQIVERNAKAQAQIIADVLDISRMITGRVRLVRAPVSLARIVLDALDTVRPSAAAKSVQVMTDVDEGPVVHADAERLQQVFWNIFANACKFTPPGGRIDVVLRERDGWTTLRVSDTGVGIVHEFLPYVFDRFRQADQSFTRSHGGLGLGLAIVKHLVEMHGGVVSAESEGEGRGATFEVRLPAEARATSSPPAAEPEDADGLPDVDLASRLVLVVDDHEPTRDLMRTIFTEYGAQVVAAGSAAEALAEFDRVTPDALVADVGMPGEDGLSMIRRIRRRPAAHGRRVPALALSAYARSEDRQAALDAGYDAFMTKPAMPADVVRTVAKLIETGGRRARARTRRRAAQVRAET